MFYREYGRRTELSRKNRLYKYPLQTIVSICLFFSPIFWTISILNSHHPYKNISISKLSLLFLSFPPFRLFPPFHFRVYSAHSNPISACTYPYILPVQIPTFTFYQCMYLLLHPISYMYMLLYTSYAHAFVFRAFVVTKIP